jgi:ADP-ribose pyrophosphatase
MTKTVVVYQTKYGSAKQYADWIASSLKADLIHLDNFSFDSLKNYDVIVFGTYIYVEKFVDIDFIIKNWNSFKDKKVVLFTSSGTSVDDPSVYEKNVPENIRSKIKYFPFKGRMGKLDFKDSILMIFPKIQFLLKGKKMVTKFDNVKIENIKPLISYLSK